MPAKPPLIIQIERKTMRFDAGMYPDIDLKWNVVDEAQGIVRGYLAVFNNIDSQKDRIRPGAFKKTVADGLQRKNKGGRKFIWPLLWMHDPEKPIGGFIDALEDKFGLLVTAQLDISTNEQGIPLNPLAMATFSGFKMGYVDELSVGYQPLQKSYDGQGIRDLLEMRVVEGSAVTMLFAANEDALVNDVKRAGGFIQPGQWAIIDSGPELVTFPKGTSIKAASGGDFPLADRNTPWSKSKAIKDIEAATGGDWSKASKYFFWSASNPTTEADHKFPFVAKSGGSMKAIPQAIISAAGVLRGAMGGAKGLDDVEGIKAKIASYYAKMGMQTPWSTSSDDKGKYHMPDFQTKTELEAKDFNDYYRLQAISDWADKWSSLTSALKSAVLDAFNVGDSPDADVQDALNGSDDSPGFVDALMDWVHEGIALNVSNYMKPDPYDSQQSQRVGYTALGYMSRTDGLELKKGAMISKDSAARLSGHADTLELAHKAIATVADDMRRYITGGQAPFNSDTGGDGAEEDGTNKNGPGSNKSRQYRPHKAPATTDQPLTSTGLDVSDADLEAWLRTQVSK